MRDQRRSTKDLIQVVRENPGISISDLARHLGISRAAAHKRVVRAKATGLLVESKPGYPSSVELN